MIIILSGTIGYLFLVLFGIQTLRNIKPGNGVTGLTSKGFGILNLILAPVVLGASYMANPQYGIVEQAILCTVYIAILNVIVWAVNKAYINHKTK